MVQRSCSWSSEPVLAACGLSGSGKTTLVEAAIPRLVERGLRVAAIKHDAHGLAIDLPHKDSGRLFAAGADIGLSGPGEEVVRRHLSGPPELHRMLRHLLEDHDLVLVEGHRSTPLPKVWLPSAAAAAPPPGVDEVVAVLEPGPGRLPAFLDLVGLAVANAQAARPLLGGVLVGGSSRRMGRAKQLIELAGRPLLDRVGDALRPQLSGLVVLGGGELPPGWEAVPRLADPPGVAGPMAGLLAAMRWAPRVSWLVVACDLPRISAAALAWLIGQRRPGCWAVLPEIEEGRVEPMLALYEPQALALLEAEAARGGSAPRVIAGHPAVHSPRVPEHLAEAWLNVNTPEELRELG